MALSRINNWVILLIIACSASFYKFSFLGKMDKVVEVMGVGILAVCVILYMVYSDQKPIKRNFLGPILLIILSTFTSMFMAYHDHDQGVLDTLYAQRALFYYLFYLLLHQMKVDPRDLEKLIFGLGIFYVIIFYTQYLLYPTIIFDAYVRQDRGTIRIYLPGADYMALSMFMSVQGFLRTNRFKYIFLALLFFSLFVMMGGRQMMAIMVFVLVLFVLIDKKVKSRFFIIFLGMVGAVGIFFAFLPIFQALLERSQTDMGTGDEYVRFQAVRFFLSDFMHNPLSYITGNGDPGRSKYGREMSFYGENYGYFIGDIGLLGNYVLYGVFFILGVVGICVRVFRIKVEEQYAYIKFMFVAIILSLVTATGFAEPDTICFILIMLYIIDVSNNKLKQEQLDWINKKPLIE